MRLGVNLIGLRGFERIHHDRSRLEIEILSTTQAPLNVHANSTRLLASVDEKSLSNGEKLVKVSCSPIALMY